MQMQTRTPERHADMRCLDNGGVVLVAGVRTTNIPDEIRDHPRVICWDTTDSESRHQDVPHNAKAIAFTRFTSDGLRKKLLRVGKDKRLTIFPMLSTGGLEQTLRNLLHLDSPAAKPEPGTMAALKQTRGAVRSFVLAEADLKVSADAEADRLFLIATERSIKTTRGSLRQCILKEKRERRLTDVPPCLEPRLTVTDEIKRTLDDCIAGLTLMRDHIIKASTQHDDLITENASLRSKLAALRGFFPTPSSSEQPAVTMH